MPDLLREQFPHFRPIVEAFGYSQPRVRGLGGRRRDRDARDARGRGRDPTCVVSTDRDAFQLCSENVSLMMTPRGVADVHVYTPERVELRYGVRPDQVPDFIGLKGDTSDNIPGIPGIGDKTAGQLIAQYGSLEEVIAHADELSPARSKAVARARRPGARLEAPRDDAARPAARRRPGRARLLAARPLRAEGDLPPLRVPRPPEPRGHARRSAPRRRADRPRPRSVPWREAALEELVLNRHDGLARAGAAPTAASASPPATRSSSSEVGLGEIRAPSARREIARTTRRRSAPRPRPQTTPCIAAYLVDPGRVGLRARRPRPRARRRARPRARRRGGDRRARPAAPNPRDGWPRSCAPGSASGARSGSTTRSSCRSPSCSRTWRRRGSGSTRTGWARSPPASRSGSRSSRRRRSSSPGSRSSSARRSSSHGSSSRSSSSPRAGRARPATRPTRASCGRSATTTRSSPSSRSGAS